MKRHRIALIALLAGIAPAGTSSAQKGNQPDFHPQVALQHEDYVVARADFHTKLLRVGPSPQSFRPLAVPADATEVTYSSSPYRLKAWLFTPQGSGRHPAVLYLHGGHAFDNGDWDAAQPYRDAGFVVAAPMFRGENGQAGNFSMYYDETDDVVAAIEYLRHLKSVDPHRIFVAGHSVGGTMTMLAALTSKHIRAAAAFSGSPDQLLYVNLAPGAKERAPFDYSNARELIMRSPLAFAAYFKCPLRIYYGSQEPQFVYTSEETAQVARSSGKDVQVIVEPGNHNTHLPLSIKDSVKFFQSFH
jgi:dipeptidyl aminopeptidase/acylaminoacyl peptidase